jgi:hypothetical protein
MTRMGVEKMSVSFDLELGEAIRAAASDASQSVSAWLAQAARDRLRLEALGQLSCPGSERSARSTRQKSNPPNGS